MELERNPATSKAATRRLFVMSVLETLSFLVLLAMMASGSERGVSIAGVIHGLLFLGYAVLVLRDREELGWTWRFVALAILTGPLGAVLVLENLRRR
ncbi:hypothetical protein BH24ACT26_BH24ACT26_18540 [soil metagenome]